MHGTWCLRSHYNIWSQVPCNGNVSNVHNMIVTVDARLQAQNYDQVAFKQMVAKLMIHYDLLFS